MKLVNAESLAAAMDAADPDVITGDDSYAAEDHAEHLAYAKDILAAIPDDPNQEAINVLLAVTEGRIYQGPPDSRLAALLAAADELVEYHDGGGFRANHPYDLFTALRDALAAFEEKA